VSGPIGNIHHDLCCEGCKHVGYTAPDGQQGYPGCDPILTQPHARCQHFSAYIALDVKAGKRVFYHAPADCPTRLGLAQGRLL